jgi:hypothetical protein
VVAGRLFTLRKVCYCVVDVGDGMAGINSQRATTNGPELSGGAQYSSWCGNTSEVGVKSKSGEAEREACKFIWAGASGSRHVSVTLDQLLVTSKTPLGKERRGSSAAVQKRQEHSCSSYLLGKLRARTAIECCWLQSHGMSGFFS